MTTPPTSTSPGGGVVPTTPSTEPLKAVPLRHPGRWVSAALLLVITAMLVHSLAFSTVERCGTRQPRFQWDIVGQYLFSARVLRGLEVTLELTVLAMGIGIVLGIVLAVMRLSPNPVMTTVSWVYI